MTVFDSVVTSLHRYKACLGSIPVPHTKIAIIIIITVLIKLIN